MRTVIFTLFVIIQIKFCNSLFSQTVIFTNPGNTYTDSDGPTIDVYSVNISNCAKVGFSMNFGFSLPWIGDGNMELPSECIGGDPCMGNPFNPLQGDCADCWDFLWAQFSIDGNPVYSELIGTDATPIQSGSIGLAQTSCLNANSATLSVSTQTWAPDESVSFSNISIVCWEKETPVIFTENPCVGDPLTLLEIGAISPTQWSWSGPAGSYSGNPWIINNADPSLDGTYSVTVTDAVGCTSTASVQVNVEQFFAEMVPGGATEICLNNCTTVRIATDRMSGSYNYVIGFGGFSDSDSYSTAEEVINICYNGSGSDPVYDNMTNTVHIPTSYLNNSIDLQLISIQDNSGDMCNGDILGMPVSIDLVGEISPNVPSDYSLCEESIGSMLATFDLTTKDSEVLGNGMGTVNWFTDMGTMIPIMMPTSFQSGSTTVYAQVQQGACVSSPVPLNLVVTPGETGNVFFEPLNGNPVCNPVNNGVDIMLEMIIPNESIEYIIDVDYVIDNVMSSTTFSSFNDPIITFIGVRDSLFLDITNVIVSGSCPFSGTFSDTTIYIGIHPEITPFDPVVACQQFILPEIEITNGSGDEKYFSESRGQGEMFLPGEIITSSQILYAYGTNQVCFDEEVLDITIIPDIDNFLFKNLGDIVISDGKCEVVRIGTETVLTLPYEFEMSIDGISILGTIERRYENVILCLNEESNMIQYDDETKTVSIPKSRIGDNIQVQLSVDPCLENDDFESIEFLLLPEESAPIPSMGFWSLLILGMMIVIVGAVKTKSHNIFKEPEMIKNSSSV